MPKQRKRPDYKIVWMKEPDPANFLLAIGIIEARKAGYDYAEVKNKNGEVLKRAKIQQVKGGAEA